MRLDAVIVRCSTNPWNRVQPPRDGSLPAVHRTQRDSDVYRERDVVKFNRDPQICSYTHTCTQAHTYTCTYTHTLREGRERDLHSRKMQPMLCCTDPQWDSLHYRITHFCHPPFTPCLLSCLVSFPFQVFTAHVIPELFQGLIVSDAYNFTLPPHLAPSSHPYPLFLYFSSISLSITKLPPPGM